MAVRSLPNLVLETITYNLEWQMHDRYQVDQESYERCRFAQSMSHADISHVEGLQMHRRRVVMFVTRTRASIM